MRWGDLTADGADGADDLNGRMAAKEYKEPSLRSEDEHEDEDDSRRSPCHLVTPSPCHLPGAGSPKCFLKKAAAISTVSSSQGWLIQ